MMAGNSRSGRKPKPDALRVLEGGKPRGAPVKTTPGVPAPPVLLTGDAAALRYYTELGAHLERMGVMALEYGEALATLAVVCADLERVREQYAQMGRIAFGTGYSAEGDPKVIESPILRRSMALEDLKTRLLGEFGLTPAMAAKVALQAAPRELSKWERLTLPARKA